MVGSGFLMVGSGFPYAEFMPEEAQARGVQIDIEPDMVVALSYGGQSRGKCCVSCYLALGDDADRLRGPRLREGTRLFEGFAGACFCRLQPFYRPALRDDPALPLTGGDKKDF
jgi:hypothetical protein